MDIVDKAVRAATWPWAAVSTALARLESTSATRKPPPPDNLFAETVLDVLREWIAEAQGEEGVNNGGPFVEMVAKRKRANWCAAVLVTAMEIAAERRDIELPIPTDGGNRLGAKRFARNVGKAGVFIDKVEGLLMPGDVLAYHRGPKGSWKGHVRMVERYDPHTRIITYIAGNEGGYPSKLRRRQIKRDRDDLVMIARLLPT